jgi:hypothetical protein
MEPSKESEGIYTRAPPERVGRAFALLTKTYHGSRLAGIGLPLGIDSGRFTGKPEIAGGRCLSETGERRLH